MVLLIPDIIVFFINIFLLKDKLWSLYVIGASVLIWSLFVFPFYLKKPKPYIFWASDTLASALYVYVFYLIDPAKDWIFRPLYSIIAIVSLAALIFIIWIHKKKHHWTAIVAHLLLDLTFTSFIGGVVASWLSSLFNFFVAGNICAVCFLALFGFFLYCNRSKRLRAWLNKAFYI